MCAFKELAEERSPVGNQLSVYLTAHDTRGRQVWVTILSPPSINYVILDKLFNFFGPRFHYL